MSRLKIGILITSILWAALVIVALVAVGKMAWEVVQ